MPDPAPQTAKPVDASARRAVAQLAAQRRYQQGQAPSAPVNEMLQSFGETPPSPEQISHISMALARQHGVQAAIEFETYARGMLLDKAQPAAERAAAQDTAPAPEVQAALNSFQEMPTDEQIAAKTAEMASRSPELAAQFRAYASQLRSDRLARQEGQYSPEFRGMLNERAARAAQTPQPPPASPLGTGTPAQLRPGTATPAPASGSAPPAAPPPGAPQQPKAAPEGEKQSKLSHAKDILQGVASVLTLGYVRPPESIKRGNRVLLEKVGLKEEEPRGGTE